MIDAVYRLLGLVAKINRRLWLLRINFIPLNVALMCALGFGLYAGISEITDALHNDRVPQRVSLASVITLHAPPQQLVSIHGLLFSDARLEYGTKRSDGTLSSIDKAWVPLVDRDTMKALFVRISPSRPKRSEPEEVTLTGMLRPVDDELKPELSRLGFNYGGVPVDAVYMLAEGEHPQELVLAVGLTAAAGIALLLFILATVKRNVIFKEGRIEFNSIGESPEPKYSISGMLILNEQTRERFTNMPAAVGKLETGETAIVSNIDASSRFFGIKTSDKTGLWMAVIQPGTISDVRRGHLFFGMQRLPAVKFRYRSTLSNADEVAILASVSGDDPSMALLGVPAVG